MTIKKMTVFITGEPARELISKRTGNKFTLSNIYVQTDGVPFPEEISVFEDPKLAQGWYEVPYMVRVEQGNLKIRFNFEQSTRQQTK